MAVASCNQQRLVDDSVELLVGVGALLERMIGDLMLTMPVAAD